MTLNESPAQQPPAGLPAGRLAEAARYALLRRLAPSMRHHLVVNLQPIGMIYEVMDRRLRAPEPNLGEVHDSAHKINGFAKAALHSCLDVVTWLAPDEEVLTTAEAGVRECLGLVATSLTFRGYSMRNEVAGIPGEIRRSPLRNLLTAMLMHATDQNPAPADLMLTAEAGAVGLTCDADAAADRGRADLHRRAGLSSSGLGRCRGPGRGRVGPAGTRRQSAPAADHSLGFIRQSLSRRWGTRDGIGPAQDRLGPALVCQRGWKSIAFIAGASPLRLAS